MDQTIDLANSFGSSSINSTGSSSGSPSAQWLMGGPLEARRSYPELGVVVEGI